MDVPETEATRECAEKTLRAPQERTQGCIMKDPMDAKFTSQRPVSQCIEEQIAQIMKEITDKITKLVKASTLDGAKHRDPAPHTMEMAEVPQSAPHEQIQECISVEPYSVLAKEGDIIDVPEAEKECEECSYCVSRMVPITTGLYRTLGRVRRVVNVHTLSSTPTEVSNI